jgi:hypothetical protein
LYGKSTLGLGSESFETTFFVFFLWSGCMQMQTSFEAHPLISLVSHYPHRVAVNYHYPLICFRLLLIAAE